MQVSFGFIDARSILVRIWYQATAPGSNDPKSMMTQSQGAI